MPRASHVADFPEVTFLSLITFSFIIFQSFEMAVIFGDSNILKYLPILKERKSGPAIQATTVFRATNSVLLQDLLTSPKETHSLVIISAISNVITSKYFDDYDLMITHCQTTFNDLLLWIQEGREALSGFAETVSYHIYMQLLGFYVW